MPGSTSSPSTSLPSIAPPGTSTRTSQIAGTIGAPELSGLIKVTDGELDVYQVNLSMRAIALQARVGGAGIDFKGSATLGPGSVSADGHIEWRNLQPYGKFHLAGTNLRVADLPEAQIDASPDLDFAIAGRRIEVTGKVLVPYAKIAPKNITNAVRASDDEVIVGGEPDDPSKRFEVTSDIGLALGDRINIDTHGTDRQARRRHRDQERHRCHHPRQRRARHREGQVHGLRAAARHRQRAACISAARSTTPASRSPPRRSSPTSRPS